MFDLKVLVAYEKVNVHKGKWKENGRDQLEPRQEDSEWTQTRTRVVVNQVG